MSTCLSPQECLKTADMYRQQAVSAEQAGMAKVASEWLRQADWFARLATEGVRQ